MLTETPSNGHRPESHGDVDADLGPDVDADLGPESEEMDDEPSPMQFSSSVSHRLSGSGLPKNHSTHRV